MFHRLSDSLSLNEIGKPSSARVILQSDETRRFLQSPVFT